jgi:hypothetical protein
MTESKTSNVVSIKHQIEGRKILTKAEAGQEVLDCILKVAENRGLEANELIRQVMTDCALIIYSVEGKESVMKEIASLEADFARLRE